MIGLLIYILVLLLVCALIWWVITQLPLPEPFGRIAQVVVVVVFAIALIYLLLGIAGEAPRVRLP